MTRGFQIRRGHSREKRLDIIEKRIENIFKENEMSLSEHQLWRGLGQIRKSDFMKILRNLEKNNKIIYHKGSIICSSAKE